MIIWIMGILLIASFICFVIYAMKGGNLTIGFFILTIVWTLVYFLGIPFGIGKPFDVIEETFAQPALTYGSTISRSFAVHGSDVCWPPSAWLWSPV